MTQHKSTAAGDRFNQILFLDPVDGYPIGGVIAGASAGLSSGARFLEGAKSANRAIPEPDTTQVTGEDGELMHEYEWSSNASRRFTIELAIEDLALAGVVQNMPVNSWFDGQYSYADIAGVYVPNVMAIFNRRSKRLSDGSGVWSGEIVLNGSLRYLGSAGFTERGAAVFRYSLTPQPSGFNQLGFTIFDSSSQQKSARVVPFQGLSRPLTAVAIKGNAIATNFLLDKAPISVALTNAIVGRASASLASVATTTPFSATFAAAPASGLRGIIWHIFQE